VGWIEDYILCDKVCGRGCKRVEISRFQVTVVYDVYS